MVAGVTLNRWLTLSLFSSLFSQSHDVLCRDFNGLGLNYMFVYFGSDFK